MDKLKELINKYGWETVLAAIAITAIITCLCSCNVTRTVTTTSSVHQRGDTTVTITSRTVESYDAKKNIY